MEKEGELTIVTNCGYVGNRNDHNDSNVSDQEISAMIGSPAEPEQEEDKSEDKEDEIAAMLSYLPQKVKAQKPETDIRK